MQVVFICFFCIKFHNNLKGCFMKRILYLLTEEFPKIQTVEKIIGFEYSTIRSETPKINPISYGDNRFSGVYEVKGLLIENFDAILILIVSGYSSFVDYLIFDSVQFEQSNSTTYIKNLSYHFGEEFIVQLPNEFIDKPKYIVEETKTDDSQSRNSQAYQRSSKFIFSELYFDIKIKKYMLYELNNNRFMVHNPTHIFGMRMLVTHDVILKGLVNTYEPFTDLNEFINEKNRIAEKSRKGNVPIELTMDKTDNTIYLSAKLDKGKNDYLHKISHDPNIGAVAIISSTLRKLGWKGSIKITHHNLLMSSIFYRKFSNKLLVIMKKLNIDFSGIYVDWKRINFRPEYFLYNLSSEKIASIYYHLFIENEVPSTTVIFNNHAGCEKSFFITSNNYVTVSKKTKLPDLVLYDSENKLIKVIEAERSHLVESGVTQLATFKKFIKKYIRKYYPDIPIQCSIITWGESTHPMVSFYLNFDGSAVFNDSI